MCHCLQSLWCTEGRRGSSVSLPLKQTLLSWDRRENVTPTQRQQVGMWTILGAGTKACEEGTAPQQIPPGGHDDSLPVSQRTVAAPAFQFSLPALRLGWRPRARLPWSWDHWTVPCLQKDLDTLKGSFSIGNQGRVQCCKSRFCSHQAQNCQGSCRAELLHQVSPHLWPQSSPSTFII